MTTLAFAEADGWGHSQWQTFAPFGIALAIGCLIGLERERSTPLENQGLPGGIRTFPLIGLLGCTAAWLGEQFHLAVFIALTAGFAGLVVMAYFLTGSRGDIGMTTEVAALLTYLFGAMVYHGEWLLAAGLAVATTVLLSLRRLLHDWVRRISEEDLYAALKLAVITIIILPLLPDVDYGPEPFRLFNPFRTWLLVVLVSGVGFLGYVGTRWLGPAWGLPLTGLLGGLISSTAVTISLAQRAGEQPALSRRCALGIGLSWAAMGVRVLVIVSFMQWQLLMYLAPPLLLASVLGGLSAVALFARLIKDEEIELPARNPFSLWSAMRLAGLFVVMLLAVRLAQFYLADTGLLLVSLLAGVTDMDSITLSLGQLVARGETKPELAIYGICLAALSNTLVKSLLAYLFGKARLGTFTLMIAMFTVVGGAFGLLITAAIFS